MVNCWFSAAYVTKIQMLSQPINQRIECVNKLAAQSITGWTVVQAMC